MSVSQVARLEKYNLIVKWDLLGPDHFKYLNMMKNFYGRRWNKDEECWYAPVSVLNVMALKSHNFNLSPNIERWYDEATEEPETKSVDIIDGLKLELYPFQKEGVAFIESRRGRCLIGDEMGLGKTPQSLAWLQLHPKVSPVIIVTPSVAKYNWKNEAKKWMRRPKIEVIDGNARGNVKLPTARLIAINYDVLHSWTYHLKKLNPQCVILDEIHYIKNNEAQRTRAVKNLCYNVKHIIGLSGTPILNRPIELYNAAILIDPGLFPSRAIFAKRYAERFHNGFRWDDTGADNLQELHEILTKTIMIRRLKKDVLKDLPPKIRQVIPMKLENRPEYRRAETDFIRWLKEIDPVKAARARRAEALVKIAYLKQLAIDGKIDESIRWIDEYLHITQGKLVVFAVHQKTIKKRKEHYGDVAVVIDGKVSAKNKFKRAEQFQEDDDIKVLIGNIKAAGVALTLTAASATCFLELGWTPGEHDQAEDRVHRIGQKSDTVNAYYLLTENTIERRMADLIDNKRSILAQVLDGEKISRKKWKRIMLSALLEDYVEEREAA